MLSRSYPVPLAPARNYFAESIRALSLEQRAEKGLEMKCLSVTSRVRLVPSRADLTLDVGRNLIMRLASAAGTQFDQDERRLGSVAQRSRDAELHKCAALWAQLSG